MLIWVSENQNLYDSDDTQEHIDSDHILQEHEKSIDSKSVSQVWLLLDITLISNTHLFSYLPILTQLFLCFLFHLDLRQRIPIHSLESSSIFVYVSFTITKTHNLFFFLQFFLDNVSLVLWLDSFFKSFVNMLCLLVILFLLLFFLPLPLQFLLLLLQLFLFFFIWLGTFVIIIIHWIKLLAA